MHRSGVRHVLRLGVVLAFVALAGGACGAPEEAKPRPLPDERQELRPGTYRTEEFEPAFSFEVGEGWSTALPEAYDLLLITQADEGGPLGFTNLKWERFLEPTMTGTTYMPAVPKDVVGWFREHPYLETRKADPVEVGGRRRAARLGRGEPSGGPPKRGVRRGLREPHQVRQRGPSPHTLAERQGPLDRLGGREG